MGKSFFGLEHLFGSVTRAKLLRIFLNHQDERFYVRELARALRTHVHAVRRELTNLEKFGIIRVAGVERNADVPARGPVLQRKYYTVNKDFPLVSELHGLMTKSDLLLQQSVSRKLQNLGTITYLALSGRLTGETEVPTDLLVVGNIKRNRLETVIREFEDALGREVNFTVMTPREFKYRKDITDKFLYSILEGKKIVLIDTSAKVSLV